MAIVNPATVKLILSAANLAVKIASMTFKTSKDIEIINHDGFNEKYRKTNLVIRNKTQFTIELDSDYFYSGKYWESAKSISPFTEEITRLCNKDNSLGAALSGGILYEIMLPKNESIKFGVGFSDPTLGSRKISCILTDNAKKAYDVIDNKSGNCESTIQSGKNEDGDNVSYYFKFSYSPGEISTVTITQHIVE